MDKIIRTAVILLLVLALGSFMFTYTVRFTETAVVTTFGSAGEGSVQSEPGLKFKFFYPVQSVTKYDNRVRHLKGRSATQQTADDSQIIVDAFAAWRVSDPLKFFQRFSNRGPRAEDHFRAAEEILRDTLLSAMGEVSKYRMDDLFTPEVDGSRLPELETRILRLLNEGRRAEAAPADATGAASGQASGPASGEGMAAYGIEVVMAGINRIVLPQETTTKVIERMGANRDRLAQELESQGQARATAIRAQAEADARKIREFAQARAAEIRALGEYGAAESLAAMNQNAELAVFLRQMELMSEIESAKLTLVMGSEDFGLGVLSPQLLKDVLTPGPRLPGRNSGDAGGKSEKGADRAPVAAAEKEAGR